MKILSFITLALFVFLASYADSRAYWPNTLEENLTIYADPDTGAYGCVSLPYANESTLVVYGKGACGVYYQIIDRYGEFMFPYSLSLQPGILTTVDYPQLISDGEGGAFIAWWNLYGIYAQRLDSLGNLLWGNEGVMISPFVELDFDICIDGQGGFYMAIAPYNSDIYVQHITGEGVTEWGEMGINVTSLPGVSQQKTKITHDDNGGALVIWKDGREPYQPYGAIFAQHLDESGNILWDDDLYIDGYATDAQIIPDGEGGFICHRTCGTDNRAYRVNSDGVILWQQNAVSWYTGAKIIEGEPGFFYLGFGYGVNVYGQRMDIDGNFHWPHGGGVYGAMMYSGPEWYPSSKNFRFQYPYFYGIIEAHYLSTIYYRIQVQSLDTLGNRRFGENGYLLTHGHFTGGNYNSLDIVSDENGVIGVFRDPYYDVFAKRVNNDGTLGGPLHLLVDLDPQDPPIQIPPGGGTFSYDLAIEDTYSIQGLFDAWIEAVLPNGNTLVILSRIGLTIPANTVITRNDLIQNVPGGAPPGEYVYWLHVGKHEYNSIWSSDSIVFEKLGTSDITPNSDDWKLTGWDEGYPAPDESQPSSFILHPPHPNPFNYEVEISFELLRSDKMTLSIYDLTGREVAVLAKGDYSPGWYNAIWNAEDNSSGMYFIRLEMGGSVMVEKVVLIK